MEADTNTEGCQPELRNLGQVLDRALHGLSCFEREGGMREGAHDLVPDRLDHRSPMVIGDRGERSQARCHHALGGVVAEGLVELGAATDIGKKDDKGGFFAHHLHRTPKGPRRARRSAGRLFSSGQTRSVDGRHS